MSQWRWEHESIFNDLDGTLTGERGGTFLPFYNNLVGESCLNKLDELSEGPFPGSVCYNMTFHRINVYGVGPDSITYRYCVVVCCSVCSLCACVCLSVAISF